MRHRAVGLPGPEGGRHHRDLRGAGGSPHLTPTRRRRSVVPGRYPRTARVNQVLREVVADTLERMADGDERLRMVTVTAVECTADLRHAVVYFSSLSEAAAEALAGHRSQLQGVIGRQVRMKRTPQLTFAADPGVAHGSRVEEILRHIHEHEDHLAAADGDEAPRDRGADDTDDASPN